jgi:DNA-binding SARP family transcriptional activator/tetratricopeptide (TPR) repeat protein
MTIRSDRWRYRVSGIGVRLEAVAVGDAAARFRLLGPVEVLAGGQVVDAGPARQRCVLAVLTLEANRIVSADQLVERVWGDRRLPSRPRNAVQVYVSLLRRALAAVEGLLIVRQADGYMARVDERLVDVYEFRTLVTQARATASDSDAVALFEQALALWHGEAFGSLDTPWLSDARTVLNKERQAAERDLTDIQLRHGQHGAVLARLSGWAARHPLDERLAGQLMLALYRSGRQADAIAYYEGIRRLLADELGVDTSPALQRLHQQILTADPAIATPAVSPAPAAAASTMPPGPVSTLAVRHSLPPDAAAFTGRAGELASIVAEASDAARAGGVVAIHAIGGMPGIGKTALAIHVAHRLRDRFPDRQLFVDLHAHTPGQEPVPPEAALAGLLSASGVDARYLPADLAGRAGLWRDRMAGQRALLVLDNAVSSAQVTPLLPGGGTCLVLITSRRYLGDLPGAVVPVQLEVLHSDEAAAMFRRLAPRAADEPAAAVRELIRLTGGLPLAISLLARVYAKHASWDLSDLARETRASMLTIAAEKDSVAAAFEVSYRTLAPGQQRFFRRLGLHLGTTIDAYAAAALGGIPSQEAGRYLDALHHEGLLAEIGYRRYGMHDLIRRYAQDLAAADSAADRDQALGRLLDYYQHTATVAQGRLGRQSRTRSGATALTASPTAVPDLSDRERALSWERTERANLLACLDHATRVGDHTRVVAFTAAIVGLLRQDGPWTDAITRHGTAVASALALGDRLAQADALHDLGIARYQTGDYRGAVGALREALGIYRDLGSRLGQANVLYYLGGVLRLTGDYPRAADALEQALAISHDLGDQGVLANTWTQIGIVRRLTGDYRGAAGALREALGIYRDLGNRLGQANALTHLGAVRRQTGDYPGATEALEAALAICRDLGDRGGEAEGLNEAGALYRASGDLDRAAACHQQALDLARAIDSPWDEACALAGLGRCALIAGRTVDAEACLKQAQEIFQRIGAAEAVGIAAELHALTKALGPARFVRSGGAGAQRRGIQPWTSLRRHRGHDEDDARDHQGRRGSHAVRNSPARGRMRVDARRAAGNTAGVHLDDIRVDERRGGRLPVGTAHSPDSAPAR